MNLRPFKRLNNRPDELFEIMVISAELFRGELTEFNCLWNEFNKLVRLKELDYNLQELENFTGQIQKENYPPKSHSKTYKEIHQPAYRVVVKKIIKQLTLV